MSIKYAVLGATRRGRIREITVEAFNAHPYDFAAAKKAASDRIRAELSSIFVTIAISLIIALLRYWWDNLANPPALGSIFAEGEPGS
jgi:hypothetical protein